MMKNKKKPINRFLFPLIVVGVLLCFLRALTNLNSDHAMEDKQQLEKALSRAAVACYASEGIYPSDLSYLEEHYGIRINNKLYTVKYEFIASNLMPDITVLENQP